MNIDPKTGCFTLDDNSVIGPALTRSKFLSSAAGKNSEVFVSNPPWCSFRLGDVGDFAFVTFFNGEKLESIQLSAILPGGSTSWDQWSQEEENARKLANEKWLASAGLTSEKYPWGTVRSVYDSISCNSHIIIHYE